MLYFPVVKLAEDKEYRHTNGVSYTLDDARKSALAIIKNIRPGASVIVRDSDGNDYSLS